MDETSPIIHERGAENAPQEALARRELLESARVGADVATELAALVVGAADLLARSLRGGGKVLFVGNGGSASSAEHLAAELVGRFERDRPPLPALALTSVSANTTGITNDFGYAAVFARQIQAHARAGDVVVALSASGTSANVVEALHAARACGCATVALTGRRRPGAAEVADLALCVPSDRVSRIQEAHLALGHTLCVLIERILDGGATLGDATLGERPTRVAGDQCSALADVFSASSRNERCRGGSST